MVVRDEEERLGLIEAFKRHPVIVQVLRGVCGFAGAGRAGVVNAGAQPRGTRWR